MIVFLIAFIVLSGAMIATCLFSYKIGTGDRFDLLSEFPYELLRKQNRLSLATRATYYLSIISLLPWFFFQIEASSFSGTLMSLTLVSFVSFALFASLFFVMSETNPTNEKAHNILLVSSSALLIISSSVEGFYILKTEPSTSGNGLLSSIAVLMAILCFTISLLVLLIIINPGLKNWPKLNAVSETDGTVSYVRPRPFVMALSEWLLAASAFFFALVSSIFLIINSLI